MNDDPGASVSRSALGERLAHHRRSRGLTGRQLGDAVAMSQAKISRIETGVGPAEPADVEAIARALGLGDGEIQSLIAQAEHRGPNKITEWRLLSHGMTMAERQQYLGHFEAAAASFRVFQPNVIPGLLQTGEYIRAVLSGFALPAFGLGGLPDAVAARVRRQQVLFDKRRVFRFLLGEGALANRISAAAVMPAQIEHLRTLADLPNVTIAIMPFERQWQVVPVHGFDLLDDSFVEIDVFHAGLVTQDRTDVRLHQEVFAALESQAVTDIDPILDRYLERYLDLARPARGAAARGSAAAEEAAGEEPGADR